MRNQSESKREDRSKKDSSISDSYKSQETTESSNTSSVTNISISPQEEWASSSTSRNNKRDSSESTRSSPSGTKKKVSFPTTPTTPTTTAGENRTSTSSSENRTSRKSRYSPSSPTSKEELLESPNPVLSFPPASPTPSEIRATRKSRFTSLSSSTASSPEKEKGLLPQQSPQMLQHNIRGSEVRATRSPRKSKKNRTKKHDGSSIISEKKPISEQKPGAVRVVSNIVEEEEYHDWDTKPDVEDPRPGGLEKDEMVVAAIPVDREEEERVMEERLKRKQTQNMIQAEKVEPEIPWFKRKSFLSFMCCIFLVLTAAIVIIVLLATKESSTTTTTTTTSPRPTIPTKVSIVLQLDSKPEETAWMLECDGEMIVEAKPGTYTLLKAYAVATGAIPYYRLEYKAKTFVGSICQLTISDTSGNGFDGGLFEVYYGGFVGKRNTNLITGGTFTSSSTTIEFTVGEVEKSSSTPSEASISPDDSPQSDGIGCTVCPDGSPVSFDNTNVPFAGALTGNLTCSDLDVVSRNTILQDAEECSLVQDSAPLCGCTNYCTTICPDGSSQPNPEFGENLLFIDEDENQVTCSDLQADLQNSNSSTSEIKCLTAHLFGEDVCGCPKTNENGFCRICQGDTNPPAEALEREILPGFRCNDLIGLGYTLRPPTGWYFKFCPACVGVGAYCGCDQPPEGGQFCRLCGNNYNDLLPEPARIVNSTILNEVTTCFHVEFAANANETAGFPSCDVFQQETSDCCI